MKWLLVIVVLVALIWGFRSAPPVQQAERIVQGVQGIIPAAIPEPTQVPAIRQASSVIKQVRGVGRLETYVVTVLNDVEMERPARWAGLYDGELVQLHSEADVVAGVDLDALDAASVHISEDGKTVAIVLPAARIFNVVVDEDKTTITKHQLSLIGATDPALWEAVRTKAIEQIRQAAIERDVCGKASAEAEARIGRLMRAVGFEVVRVSSEAGVCE